ncbi:MAG: tetratricopeptide repeat protein [bacterium]
MQARKNFAFLTLLLCFCNTPIAAQVPDSLKSPYRELVKQNNTGNYDNAIARGKLLLEQAQDFPHTYGQLAAAFEKAERIEQGLAYFDSLRQQRPDNPYIHYALALFEDRKQNSAQAIDYIKKCIEGEPNFLPAYRQLTVTYNSQKEPEKAAEYFQLLLKNDSLNVAAHYGLGCVYY